MKSASYSRRAAITPAIVAIVFAAAAHLLHVPATLAQDVGFHGAPASAQSTKNPYAGQGAPEGKNLYGQRCAACHGQTGDGSGNIPSLASGKAHNATDGEVFWYITRGDVSNGMPSWAAISENDRWQIVTYVKTFGAAKSSGANPGANPNASPSAKPVVSADSLPVPKAPFTDYRYEVPGKTRKITLNDLPEPFATQSAGNSPELAPRPEGAMPKVPEGFKVAEYATGLGDARLIRTAPNGDFFLAASRTGDIVVFRGITAEGKPEKQETFATGLNRPFGINFYPPGPNPEYIYVGNTDAVVRFPYRNDDMKARGPAEKLADLPAGKGHWTRDIQFSPDGRKMFVSVGSASNVDDPDTTPGEKNRADVLEFNPDGSGQRIFAYGIRNCVGLAVSPETGELVVLGE